jgi:TolB-like protein/class 3 adenylate cyclase/Tfp pilus assembly protein PilF
MPAESKQDSPLEIAHVLFIDIVGYSKLLTTEQRERLQELNRIVRDTEQFRAAEADGKLLRIPTGDGMVLAFFTSPDAPVRCAVAISRALTGTAHLPLRMGIHSGPVESVEDVNDKVNLAGAGVNTAQRVMDCGDAGHILLSSRAADDLAQHAEWKAQLHYLGEMETKHGTRVRVANLYDGGIGNAELPQKLKRQRRIRKRRIYLTAGSAVILLAIIALGVLIWQRRARSIQQAEVETQARRQKSVAVLPFENASTQADNAIFAEGVHREVLSNLAKIADLKVISRTSVMHYKPGTDRNLKQIANDLSVNYVVEGGVQREANHIHITVELVDARTDTQAWAETYDGNLSDVLSFQTEIAQRISNQLGAKLSPHERSELTTRPTQDIAAFESYIRARALMETLDLEDQHEKFLEDNIRAIQLLEQAVARDPKFAAGYWALTEANIQLYRAVEPQNPEYRTRAETALKEARRLAPEAGETYYAQSRIAYYGYLDFTRALGNLEEAAKSLPNNADVTLTRALLYRRFGRWQEAYALFVRASELNPQDLSGYINAGSAALALRWWNEVDQTVQRVVKHFPRRSRVARIEGAISLRMRGDVAAGNKALESLNLQIPSEFTPLFYINFWKRDYGECRRLLAQVAKYPEFEDERWDKELQLFFVTKAPFDQEAARVAEKKLQERLRQPINREEEGDLKVSLSNVKMILGEKEESIRLSEESVKQHPVSEDALANTERLHRLAYMYVYAGEHERALQTFAKLVSIPGTGENYGTLKYNPVLDELRKDPRFDTILKNSQQPFPRM